MDEKFIKCPSCKIGELVSETIEEHPNGERVETYCYSCGHQAANMIIPTCRICLTPEIPSVRLKSGEKVGKKSKYEIKEDGRNNDIDNPNRPVLQMMYWDRKSGQTNVFQVIQYTSGEIKHVHCKTCNSEYKLDSTEKLEDLFIIDVKSHPKIECLRCHAKFEQ